MLRRQILDFNSFFGFLKADYRRHEPCSLPHHSQFSSVSVPFTLVKPFSFSLLRNFSVSPLLDGHYSTLIFVSLTNQDIIYVSWDFSIIQPILSFVQL